MIITSMFKKPLSKLFFYIAFMLGAFNATGQVTEKNYKIYSVQQGKEVSMQTIIDEMEHYDVLFIGEEHNDSVTHYIEHKTLEMLYAAYNEQVVLSRAWSNYRDYKPMVEFAKKNHLEVICANAPSRYTNLVGRLGQEALMALSDESKRNFAPLPYDTASGKYYDKLMGLTSHDASATKDTSKKAPVMSPMGNFNLIMAQSLWDATMAYSIAEYLKRFKDVKILQENGRFHSDEGFAIVEQLKNFNPNIRSLIISTSSDESFPNINWQEYKEQGDYIIITDPAVPRTYKD